MVTWGSIGMLLRGYTVDGELKNENRDRVTDFCDGI